VNELAIERHVIATNTLYEELVAKGVPKEDARAILPQNTMTSMYVAGNFQAWMDFLKLRVSKHAQREVRVIAISIWERLGFTFPLVFRDLVYEGMTFDEWCKQEGFEVTI
jgi:thymidylate synthase (FAD)